MGIRMGPLITPVIFQEDRIHQDLSLFCWRLL